jgi:hypothetical protein
VLDGKCAEALAHPCLDHRRLVSEHRIPTADP